MNKPVDNSYKSVRALDRGIALLLELNNCGRASPARLSASTGIDRATVYRLLHTLAARDLVARSPSDESWYPLRGVKGLANGYVEDDQVVHIAAQKLAQLLHHVQWPSDFATFDRGAMVIQETTHRFSPFSVHRNMIGRHRGLFTSAVGKAALLSARPDRRSAMINMASSMAGDRFHGDDFLGALQRDYQARGYTWSVGGSDSKHSAIALPVAVGTRASAVNIVFFRSAATPEKIAATFLDRLAACVASIESAVADCADATA